ncbi:LolA family protein [Bacillus nitroreducens]
MRKTLVYLSMILLIGLLAGCKGEMAMSSEEIVSKVLSAKEDKLSYYGEGIMKLTTLDEGTEDISFQEYAAKDGKRKMVTKSLESNLESYALNDGNKLISYEPSSQQAFSMDLSDDGIPALTSSPKEQLMTMLDSIKETHDYDIVGEEKFLDLNVYHLKATPNTDSSFLGEIELWVDQKTWFIVKLTSVIGDAKSEVEYSLIDFSPEFQEDTFTLDIPESVTITPIESEIEPKFGTIEEAQNTLEQEFLVFAEEDLAIDNVEVEMLQGIINRPEITVYYLHEGIPSVLVSVFPTPEEAGTEINPGKWQVRGQNAEYDDFINAISWDENGLRYTIIIENPDLSIEEVIEMTKNMVPSNEM